MNRKILYIIALVLLIVVSICTFINLTYSNKKRDSIKFKKEYESYNENLLKLNISKKNPIKYSNYEEIISTIKEGTGVIYLGTPSSNWCRNIVNPLFDAVNNNDIDEIYYLDISDDMDYYTFVDDQLTYMLDDNGNELKGKDDYFNLVEVLKDFLSLYTIELDGVLYSTDNYRIYLPTVIFVKDGNIVGLHVSTVVSHTDSSKKLNDKEYEELYDIYEGYILDMSSDTCDINSDGSGC